MAENQEPSFDINKAVTLATFLKEIMPLNLSKDLSINLAKVSRYEPVEKLDEKDKPTGEFVPAIFFGNDDFIFLTPEQNAVFRPIWNIYAQGSSQVFALMASMFPQPEISGAAQSQEN